MEFGVDQDESEIPTPPPWIGSRVLQVENLEIAEVLPIHGGALSWQLQRQIPPTP